MPWSPWGPCGPASPILPEIPTKMAFPSATNSQVDLSLRAVPVGRAAPPLRGGQGVRAVQRRERACRLLPVQWASVCRFPPFRFFHRLTFSPGRPGSPGGPWGPCLPGGPRGPGFPAAPGSPCSPGYPLGPLSPALPGGPGGPTGHSRTHGAAGADGGASVGVEDEEGDRVGVRKDTREGSRGDSWIQL